MKLEKRSSFWGDFGHGVEAMLIATGVLGGIVFVTAAFVVGIALGVAVVHQVFGLPLK